VWLLGALILCGMVCGESDLATSLEPDVMGQGLSNEVDDGGGSCGCESREDDFPPGAGFAFKREGYVVIKLEGGKATKKRQFFEDERVTFKEILSPGNGKTFPSNGQTAILRYTEFTSNECLPDTDGKAPDVLIEEMEQSVVQAVEGLDDLILRMSLGEKAMWFTSLDLGCVRVLQAWLQWWLEATCSEMVDAGARIFEVELVRLDGHASSADVARLPPKRGALDWFS